MKSNPLHRLPLLFIIAGISVLLGACSKSNKIENHLQKAREYIASEEFRAAEIELKNVLSDDNKNVEAIAAMGTIYLEQGRFRDAYPYLNALKSLAPEDIESRNSLSQIEFAAGLREQAREDANYVLAVDPMHQEAPLMLADTIDSTITLALVLRTISTLPESPAQLTALGSIDLKNSDVNAAKAHFEAAIALNPDFPTAYSGLFAIHLIQGNKEEAEAFLKQAADLSKTRSGAKVRYAQYLTQKPDRKAATAYLAEIIEKAPDYLPALSPYAELIAQDKNLEKAKELTEQALRLDPIDPTAMRLKGTLLVLDRKIEEAIEQLTKMLELYPNDLKASYQIALAYMGKNDLGRAANRLATVVAAAPNHLEATALLSSLQTRNNDYSGAIITLKNFLKAQPNSAEAQLLLADVYNRQGNSEDAISIYDALDQTIPNNPQLDYLAGLSQLQQQNPSEARASFEAALTDNAMHLQSVEQLTSLDLGERNFDTALARINGTIDLAPDVGVLYVIRGQIENSMGDPQKAELSFNKALETEPSNRTAHMLLSRLALAAGNSEKAMSQLNTLLQTSPDDIGALASIAGIHEKANDTNNAKATYERILEIKNDFLPALNNLAYLYSSGDEQSEKAFEYAQQARELAPLDPYTADTLGWIVFKRKEYTWALSLLQESGSRLSQHPEVAYHLGAIQYVLGDTQEALRNLEKAVSSETEYVGLEKAKASLRILKIDTLNPSPDDIDLLEKQIAANEEDAYAYATLGAIQLQLNDFAAATNNFRSALEISPDHIAAKTDLAIALAEQGETEEAMNLAREATRQAPNNLQTTYAQGRVAYLVDDHTWAASLLQDVARRDSDNPSIHGELAHALLAVGQIENAIEAANRAIIISEDESISQLRDQLLYIANPNSVSKPETPNTNSLGTQLVTAIANDNAAVAQIQFEAILKSYSKQAQAKLGLANILAIDTNNAERVYNLASEVRAAFPDNAESKALQGIARYQQNEYSQAAQAFAGIRNHQWNENATWEFYYGLALKETGDSKRSLEMLSKAINSGLSNEHKQQAAKAITELESK